MAFLHDVDFLHQCRRDVDRGVGDHDRPWIGGNVHQEDVADAPAGAQAGSARDDLGHQFVGVQAAFHQRFGVTAAYQRHRHRRRFVAVLAVHDAVVLEVQAIFLGDGADALLGTDQDRVDEPGFGGQQRALERFAVAGVNHRHVDRCQALGALDTSTCKRAYLSEMVISGIALRLVMIFSRGASTSALPETTSS
jgi:hypothetical protein